jgi:N-methylhydantoinase A
MITTEGFRDVIEIGRQRRKNLFDLHQQRPKPMIPRRFRFTVPGRLGSRGEEIESFDEASARDLASHLKDQDIGSVTICFINSYVNPCHERHMRDILNEVHPDCAVALSSETVPKFREHGRFTTTVVRAVLLPVMSRYFDRLKDGLVADEFDGSLLILKSNGGIMGVDLARERPEEQVGSGPAGGVAYARHLSEETEFPNIISTDMGGTTFDASIVEGGEGLITHDYDLEWEMPLIIPMLDIRSVGAGGGSIAWVDAGGSLRVGPQSAGSEPGPACYGRAGADATVTDANLILGRLEPTLSGKFDLDMDAAEAVVSQVAEQIGLSTLEAAESIIAICCENMAQAVKLVLIDRGRDPRDFVLASFGGAGPMHACAIARSMSIPKVIVPANAGVASAFGAIAMDLRHDLEDFYYGDVAAADFDRLNQLYESLEARGRELLMRDGVAAEHMSLSRNAQMRYTGQFWEVSAPIPSETLSEGSVATILDSFHKAHETEHGVCSPSFPVEFVSIGLTANGQFSTEPELEVVNQASSDAISGMRDVYFDGTWVPVSVYSGAELGSGSAVQGPAIIEYPHFETVLPKDTSAEVDRVGNLIVSVG